MLFITAIASSKAKIKRGERTMQAILPCKNAWSPGLPFRPVTGASLLGGGGGPRRTTRAVESAGKEEETPCCAELALSAAGEAAGADLVTADVQARCLLILPARARRSASSARADAASAEPAAACTVATAVVRRSASSFALAASWSASVRPARWCAVTRASISAALLEMSPQLSTTAVLTGVGREAHVAWGPGAWSGPGLDETCRGRPGVGADFSCSWLR